MSIRLYSSKRELSEAQRNLVALLNRQLADAIDLSLRTKNAHWNVKGANFVSLHTLFDEIAESFATLIDELAERVVELGGVAEGTLQAVHTTSRLAEYDRSLHDGVEHLAALEASMESFAASTQQAIETATVSGDATTADVLTEVSRAADKFLWKLNAHR